jgi:hypothetical protein
VIKINKKTGILILLVIIGMIAISSATYAAKSEVLNTSAEFDDGDDSKYEASNDTSTLEIIDDKDTKKNYKKNSGAGMRHTGIPIIALLFSLIVIATSAIRRK